MGTRARRRLRDGLVGLCVLVCTGGWPLAASAAPTRPPEPTTSTSYARSPTPFSVTLSPARLVVGQRDLGRTQQLLLVNRGQEPVSLVVEKRNFVAGPDGGLSYRPDAPYGAAGWIDVDPMRMTLAPGASQQVSATVALPAQPEPGDHQMALVFLAPAGTGPGNVKVNRGIGAPVYVTVPGATNDSVRLDDLTGPGWSLRARPTLTARLTSTGTVHRDFRGPGALVVGVPGHQSRFADFTVSRGAERVVSTTWEAPLVCVCHPVVSVTNADGVAQSVSTRVVVLPWWLPGTLVALLAALALVLGIRRRRRPRAGG